MTLAGLERDLQKQAMITLQEMGEILKLLCFLRGYIGLKNYNVNDFFLFSF